MDQKRGMRRWLSLFLLIGALAGLFGQEMAFATASVTPMQDQSVADASMNADCAEMMGIEQGEPAPEPGAPCTGMTFECIAKMGCATPAALLPAALLNVAYRLWQPAPSVSFVTSMSGRSVTPELHPPALLG